MKVKSEREVAQSCLTLRDPMDYSLPGSFVHGIFQARVLEWGAIALSGGSTTYLLLFLWGFKESPCKTLYRGPSVIYWRRQWHPTPVLVPGKSMDGGAWWAAVHGVAKSQTWLSDFPFTFYFHALEKEMAAHSSVLAWRIPGYRGAWWAAVYGVAPSRTQLKWLSSSSSSVIYTLNNC